MAAPARTRAPADPLALSSLPGVGPKTAAKLAEQGLATLEDLVRLLPLGYRDRRQRSALAEAVEGGAVAVEATIRRFSQRFFRGRYFATLECLHVADGRETAVT